MEATAQQLCLADNQPLVLTDSLGTLVHCVSGKLWLTQYTDCRDIVLEAGDTFEIDLNTTVVILAMSDACLLLEHASIASPLAKLSQWLGALFQPARYAQHRPATGTVAWLDG